MFKDPKEFIKHILDECSYLVSVTTNLDFDSFMQDETLKLAVARSLEVIGEATKKIPTDFKQRYNSVEWKNMAGGFQRQQDRGGGNKGPAGLYKKPENSETDEYQQQVKG